MTEAVVAWGAYTTHRRFRFGTELGIMPESWVPGDAPKVPTAGTRLTVFFPDDRAVVDLVEISGDTAVIQTFDGTKWHIENVGAKSLRHPPAVPSGAPATFWTVKERIGSPRDQV
jgi:hypothetical protein